jgi:hypothetical protein
MGRVGAARPSHRHARCPVRAVHAGRQPPRRPRTAVAHPPSGRLRGRAATPRAWTSVPVLARRQQRPTRAPASPASGLLEAVDQATGRRDRPDRPAVDAGRLAADGRTPTAAGRTAGRRLPAGRTAGSRTGEDRTPDGPDATMQLDGRTPDGRTAQLGRRHRMGGHRPAATGMLALLATARTACWEAAGQLRRAAAASGDQEPGPRSRQDLPGRGLLAAAAPDRCRLAPAVQLAPWRTAVLGRFRVERRAGGPRSSVMASASVNW